jgi:signal transduction histidine kinase
MTDERTSQTCRSFPNRRQEPRRGEDRKLHQRERELLAVRQICLALFQHINLNLLVETALTTALEVVNAEAGSILLADAKAQTLVFHHVIGEKAELLRGRSIPWKAGIAGAVFTSGQPEIILDAKKDPRHFAQVDESTGYATRDMIAMPLKRWSGEMMGVLTVLNKRNGSLNEDDVAVLTIIAALSAEMIEQNRLYQEAKLAEMVRLLGDASHDLKNMLQPIVFGTKLLHDECHELLERARDDEPRSREARREFCDDAANVTNTALRRIHDRFKEIADCVKGLSTPPRFELCGIADVVAEVVKTLSLYAEEKKISLRTMLNALPQIVADERRLYTAFYNLVNNAISEVPPGGSITIGGYVLPEHKSVLLWVTDTGKGMLKEVLNSLFTPRVVSRKQGGTGLGTKIVKDVVDVHGGQIFVESEEGVGTTFYLKLPFGLLPGVGSTLV